MQKSIYSFAITAFSAMTILIGCEPSAEKVDSEKAKLEAAEIDLIKVKENYFIEYNKLKYKSEKQFSDNATRIRELRKQNKAIKKEVKGEYEKTITDLEKRNDVLKAKISYYKEYRKDAWKSFKHEFSRDMEELQQSLIDLTKKM